MARQYGEEFRERALMSVISDLLGIRHFTTSKGGTVRKDFLLASATALGVPDQTLHGMTKDEVLIHVIETATKRPVDHSLLSEGETVTNPALQSIIDGIIEHGVVGRPEVPDPGEGTEVDEDGSELEIDPLMFKDLRDRRLMEVAIREGQDKFRTSLIEAYDGKCAVTGFEAAETLEAAHIYPYRGTASNRVTNGLLLRADIHTLFDRGALAVHEMSHKVLIKPHLALTQYRELAQASLRLPRLLKNRPAVAALRSHREWTGL